jgi:hypothetical protein
MKKQLAMFGLICMSVLLLSYCKKDKAEDETNNTPKKVIPQEYAKKWVVNSKDGIIFQWLEFTELGYYFLSFDDGTFVSGLCTYDESSDQIILINFGYVEIVSIDGNVISINVYVNETGETIDLVATGSDEIPSSTNTDLLCRTWDIVEYTMTNESTSDVTILYPTTSYDVSRYDVAFTTYGTYFTTMIYSMGGSPGEMYENRYWKWSDASENELCYGTSQEMCDSCGYTTGITSINTDELILEGSNESGGTVYTFYIRCSAAD